MNNCLGSTGCSYISKMTIWRWYDNCNMIWLNNCPNLASVYKILNRWNPQPWFSFPFLVSDQQMINQTTLTALSHVTSLCYCALSKIPLFLHLSKTFNPKDHLSLPLPLMAVINGGQTGTGKLKVRSFCIAPSSSCGIVDGTRHVTKFYKEIGRQLNAKQGVSLEKVKILYFT